MALYNAIKDHRLSIPDDPDLIDELANVRLTEKRPNQFKMENEPGKHDDRVMALGLCVADLFETLHELLDYMAAYERQEAPPAADPDPTRRP